MVDYIAVYGSLRKNQQAAHKMHKLEYRLDFIGEGLVDGSLFDLGWYPGIKLGTGLRTVVDVFKLPQEQHLREIIFLDLDTYEGYREKDPLNSLFVRKVAKLLEKDGNHPSGLDVLIYEYNYPTNRAPLVANGDWNDYRSVPN